MITRRFPIDYLVPFLRRYATFLELDQEDVAMRFVREVQRADSIPPPRLDRPLIAEPRKARGWTGAILIIVFLTIAAAVYLYESDRHRQTSAAELGPHASANVASGTEGATSGNVPEAPAAHYGVRNPNGI
jgi:cytoskeletal protein RodZ